MWIQQWNNKRNYQAYNLPANLMAKNTCICPLQPVSKCTATWNKCAAVIIHLCTNLLIQWMCRVMTSNWPVEKGPYPSGYGCIVQDAFIAVSAPRKLLQHTGFSLTTGINLLDIISQWNNLKLMQARKRLTDVFTPYHNVQMLWHKYYVSSNTQKPSRVEFLQQKPSMEAQHIESGKAWLHPDNRHSNKNMHVNRWVVLQ